MTCLGVWGVFLLKTPAITMASASIRYTTRHVAVASTMRSSWQRRAILGIGRECGIPSVTPCCSWRRRMPASSRAAAENGGDFTSPRSQTSGLSPGAMSQAMSVLTY